MHSVAIELANFSISVQNIYERELQPKLESLEKFSTKNVDISVILMI